MDWTRRGLRCRPWVAPTDEPLGFVLHRAARELAERYQVDLEVEVDDSISVQPEQQHALMRITREAVSNAVRHGKAERVHVTLSRTGDRRRLVIQDNGQGFDVGRAVADSTGYGLVSMRDRARNLPGTFDVDGRHAERDVGDGDVVTEKPIRLVMADDNARIRGQIRRALEAGGCEVCAEGANAEEAIALAMQHRPDVALLDIHMPGNGIQAAQQISRSLPQTAIVMLTQSKEDDDLFDSLRAGAVRLSAQGCRPGDSA